MGSINKGDMVRVTTTVGRFGGQEGTIDEVVGSNGVTAVLVNFGDEGCWFTPEDVEVFEVFDPAPEPVVGGKITFYQILKGDRVRTVREFEDGFVVTMEGVAEVLRLEGNGEMAWRNRLSSGKAGNHCIAPSRKGSAVKQHHILVARVEPKDHVILFEGKEDDGPTTVSTNLYTKSRAEELVEQWNSQYKTISHRAVRVDLDG